MSSELAEVRKQVFTPDMQKHRETIGYCAATLHKRLQNLQRHDEYFVRAGIVFLALYAAPIIPWSMTILLGLSAWLTHAYDIRKKLYTEYLEIRQEALATYDWATDSNRRGDIDALDSFKKLTTLLAEVTNPGRIIQPKDFAPEPTLLRWLGGGVLNIVGLGSSAPVKPVKPEASTGETGSFSLAKQFFQYNPDLPSPMYQKASLWVGDSLAKYGSELSKIPTAMWAMMPAKSESVSEVLEKPKLN